MNAEVEDVAVVPLRQPRHIEVEDGPLHNDDGSPTRFGWRAIGKALREPIPSKKRKGRAGLSFDYIDARQVEDRLDAVVGPGNWSTHYYVHPTGAVECTLTIFGVPKANVGYSNNPDAAPADAFFEHEPLKAAYSDAFKRAAVAWGVGRFLYRKN